MEEMQRVGEEVDESISSRPLSLSPLGSFGGPLALALAAAGPGTASDPRRANAALLHPSRLQFFLFFFFVTFCFLCPLSTYAESQ